MVFDSVKYIFQLSHVGLKMFFVSLAFSGSLFRGALRNLGCLGPSGFEFVGSIYEKIA